LRKARAAGKTVTDSLTAFPHTEFAMAPSGESSEAAVSSLTRGLATGDEAAFREFHAQYFHRLFRYLIVVAHGDELLARDALQETFVRVARHARRFDDAQAFWDWLAVLGRSSVADGGRRQSRHRRLLALFRHEPPPPAPCGEEEALRALDSALALLGESDRALLNRKYNDGCTAQRIAAECGISEGAVESRLVRIRRELRARILKALRHDE
jgi:RNA polymerase sigma-70 factor (ECF subfamily)